MVLKNIASFLKSHPLIFVFFSMLQIASMLTAVYLYSDMRAKRVDLEKYRGTTSVFEIEYPNGIAFETVAQKIQNIAVQTKYPVANITVFADRENQFIADYKYNAANVDMGKQLQNPNDILLDAGYARENGIEVGDTLTALNRSFTVSGLTLPTPGVETVFEIGYGALEKSDTVYKLGIRLENLPTKYETEAFSTLLTETFDAAVLPPQPRNYTDEYGFDAQLLISFSVMLLVILNVSFLYQYILIKRKNKFAIFSICGCKRSRAFFILLAEILCYFLFHLGITAAIWFGFLKNLLIREETAEAGFTELGIVELLIPAAVYLAGVLCIFVPGLIKYARQTTVRLLYSEKE